jgi:hypothetical protein
MSKKYFALVAICVLALTGSAMGNLLSNPGFETWTAGAGGPPDNWELSGTSIDATQEAGTVYAGTYSVNLTWTTTSTRQLFQLVPITAGTDYEFTFWTYDNTADGSARVAVRWMDSDTNFVSGYYGDYSVDNASWQQLSSGAQTAAAGAAFASCEIRVYDVSGWPGTATCYADDAVFQEAVAPEPDTLTIYEIQYNETTQGSGSDCFPSPHEGERVRTFGTVSAVKAYGDFWIQEADATWSGVFVYFPDVEPVRGDFVMVEADVAEYYGLTELTNPEVTILSSGNPLPSPLVINTGDLAGGCGAGAEAYEGVVVMVQNVSCVADTNEYGEWYVDDYAKVACQIDDDMYTYDPYLGQPFTSIIGVCDYSYSEYEILPREALDICEAVAVELASFDAAAGDGQVTLSWRTAAEIETHSFNIYRDGEKIASVPAFGDAHDYTYVDRDVENGTAYSYQLSDVDLDGTETMHPMVCSVTPNAVPGEYALNQNYPNPFNPNTEISYAIPAETHVTLSIYNLLGQEITTLVDEVKEAGQHAISWDAADNASGVYFYHLQTDDFSATKKMVFMK